MSSSRLMRAAIVGSVVLLLVLAVRLARPGSRADRGTEAMPRLGGAESSSVEPGELEPGSRAPAVAAPPPESRRSSIVLWVLDRQTSSPVPGTSVSSIIGGRELDLGRTDSRGALTLSVSDDAHLLLLVHPEYAPIQRVVSARTQTEARVHLERRFALRGIVVDPTKRRSGVHRRCVASLHPPRSREDLRRWLNGRGFGSATRTRVDGTFVLEALPRATKLAVYAAGRGLLGNLPGMISCEAPEAEARIEVRPLLGALVRVRAGDGSVLDGSRTWPSPLAVWRPHGMSPVDREDPVGVLALWDVDVPALERGWDWLGLFTASPVAEQSPAVTCQVLVPGYASPPESIVLSPVSEGVAVHTLVPEPDSEGLCEVHVSIAPAGTAAAWRGTGSIRLTVQRGTSTSGPWLFPWEEGVERGVLELPPGSYRIGAQLVTNGTALDLAPPRWLHVDRIGGPAAELELTPPPMGILLVRLVDAGGAELMDTAWLEVTSPDDPEFRRGQAFRLDHGPYRLVLPVGDYAARASEPRSSGEQSFFASVLQDAETEVALPLVAPGRFARGASAAAPLGGR